MTGLLQFYSNVSYILVLKQAPVQILKTPWPLVNTKRVVLNVKLNSNYGTLFKVTSINDVQFFESYLIPSPHNVQSLPSNRVRTSNV